MSEQAPSTADFFARIALLEAAVSARDIAIAERDDQLRRERAEAALRIQRLQLRIDRFNRKAFGRSSEKLGQMRLELDDLETDFAASVPDIEMPIVADTDKVRVLPVRSSTPTCHTSGSFASRLAHAARAAAAICAPWAKIARRCSIWSPRLRERSAAQLGAIHLACASLMINTLKKGAREQGALLIDEMLGLEVRDQAIRRQPP
ncbi:transposase [Mesorhizobium sp. M1121]|uniref:transposase n=1 Tax=Mesorhizobium sp. M1121 TaxID=2957058 RepID=UPI00333D9065